MLERRQRRMGLRTLRFWDLEVDPDGRPPLKPFDSAGSFIGPAGRIFQRVEQAFGRYFQTMADEGLLDLESRKWKAPGGYCATLPHRKRPFIFMNAAGVGQDVRTLLHESGHAFHSFEASAQPLIFQRFAGSEMAELASMSMELLGAAYLEASEGGYYLASEAARARAEHLESILLLLTHIASVAAFQHWIYPHSEGANRDARDAAWLRIRDRFQPGLD
jgi:oligoendopeptidase F